MVKGSCSNFTPAIIDTDGALRWVGTAGFGVGSATFFDNAAYLRLMARNCIESISMGLSLMVGDYSHLGIAILPPQYRPRQSWNYLWMRIPRPYDESVNIEVDASGMV